MTRRYLLIDRDGTLIVDRHYLSRPEQVELIPGAGEALRTLADAGWGIAVVTNQSGIARGRFSEEDMHAVHQRIEELLASHGVRIDGFWFCPHGPDDACDCRKPRPGLALQAAGALGFDPASAVVVGDKAIDVELGRAIGARSVLVRTGYGREEERALEREAERNPGARPDVVIDSLADLPRAIASLFR